uniref:ENT domain-containing protein n=1 Tax=Cuerna arida TaxID=1464854 RepID=A0A1B6EYZ8_9HEMI
MPTQQPVARFADHETPNNRPISKYEYLLLLRKQECLAYHYLCGAFRAQGHLTPEKLKLLKEVAAVLEIPESRHKAECRIAVNDDELNAIAENVAGPNSELEWEREGKDKEMPQYNDVPVPTAYLHMADIVAEFMRDATEQLQNCDDCDDDTEITKTLNLKFRCLEDTNSSPNISSTAEPKVNNVKEVKKEEKDGESSALVSSTTDLIENQPMEEDKKVEEILKTETDPDTVLMPPPPPIVNVPHSVMNLPSTPPSTVITVPPTPVITVPPSSSITVIPATPKPITLPVSSTPDSTPSSPQPSQISPISSPIITVSEELQVPVYEEPLLSESDEIQFVSFPEALDSSLPPLVVVPPAEPVITIPHSSSFSPPVTPTSTTLVLPSGMSIKLRDDGETKSRKRSISQDAHNSGSPAVKTMAFTQITKMTPIMVSAAGVTGQGQVKVTPIINRSKMGNTSTQSTLPSSAQKVIIVSNTSAPNSPIVQRAHGVPVTCSVAMPVVRGHPPRLQPATGLVQSSAGTARLRPKMVTVPKARPKSSPLIIPNLQLKNPVTLKQDNVTVVDTSMKRLPVVPGAAKMNAKILPKPQGMFIVNPNQGTHNIATSVGGGQAPRMITSRVIAQAEGAKQNVVILQKGGGGHRALTLTNTNKDFMQKLMSKKCVVIQSSKTVPKNISPKPTPPVSTSNASNVVVLDLSQEQFRQNLSTTTIAEILQASGIMTSSAAHTLPTSTPRYSSVSAPDPNFLQASKTLEEVTLSDNQSESIVTLDEAVELLGDSVDQSDMVMEAELLGDNTQLQSVQLDSSQAIQMAVADTPDQIFTISPEELAAGDITFMTDKSVAMEPVTSQIVIETLPAQICPVSESASTFPLYREGAVTIQHSNTDMPTNMCLEEYSSQQMENQGLN